MKTGDFLVGAGLGLLCGSGIFLVFLRVNFLVSGWLTAVLSVAAAAAVLCVRSSNTLLCRIIMTVWSFGCCVVLMAVMTSQSGLWMEAGIIHMAALAAAVTAAAMKRRETDGSEK